MVPEVVDIDGYDYEERLPAAAAAGEAVVLLFATYGDGDPTDDAMDFMEWLSAEAEIESEVVRGLKFAVFGLGNRQYEHFNATGKQLYKDLAAAGGEAIVKRGEGDDDADIEADFADWREELWTALEHSLDVSLAEGGVGTAASAAYDVASAPEAAAAAVAEAAVPGGRGRPPYTEANPFVSTVLSRRELHADGSDRSCMHVEFDLGGSNLRYSTGDHVGVLPCNDPALVERAAAAMDLDGVGLDDAITVAVPEDADLPLLPSPVTLRALLTHHVDLTGPVRRSQLLALASCCADDATANELRAHAAAKGDDHSFKLKYHDGKASAVDVMLACGCRPSIGLFLGSVVGRLACRFFSISSSPKAHPKAVHVTAALVREDKPYNSGQLEGVCTHYLSRLSEGDRVAIFLRQSAFRLPRDSSRPVVMVGPGTGLAPFRGFLQERAAAQAAGSTLGPAVLFFGCRRRDHDFIYEEELREFERQGVMQLEVAFSREGKAKRYVQHALEERGAELWEWIAKKKGSLYVCGDAKHMAKDVDRAMHRVAVAAGMTEQAAESKLRSLHDEMRYQRDVW